jgi:membrane protease YdiL (CAAX protease family)
MAPLVEEFAFRGRMQHALEHALGVVPAIALSAVTFSLLHGSIDAIHHLVFGVFAGWVVWRTGSIWAAVYMHGLNNAIAELATYVPGDLPLSPGEAASRFWPYAIVIGVLASAGLVLVGRRIDRRARLERPGFGTGWRKRSVATAVSMVS